MGLEGCNTSCTFCVITMHNCVMDRYHTLYHYSVLLRFIQMREGTLDISNPFLISERGGNFVSKGGALILQSFFHLKSLQLRVCEFSDKQTNTHTANFVNGHLMGGSRGSSHFPTLYYITLSFKDFRGFKHVDLVINT